MNTMSKRIIAAVVVLVALVVSAAMVVSRITPSGADDAAPGRTAEATVRSLVTTLKESGTVERVDQRLITFTSTTNGPQTSASPTAPAAESAGTSGAATTDTAGAEESTFESFSAAQAPAEDREAAAPDTAPAGPAQPDGEVSAAAQGDAADEPPTTTEPAPTTTEPAPTTTEPAPPPTTTTTARSAPAEPRPATPPTTAAAGSQPAAGASQTPAATQQTTPAAAADEDPATVTALLEVGATADRGTVLYAADDEPTIALFGTIPAWRVLESGVDAGGDVRQLEENLVALGFGSGITVDDSFTSTTAAQVRAWEATVGRAEPDGRVEVGDIVFLSGPGDVLAHETDIGAFVEPGDPVLQLGSKQLVVKATIDANDAAVWAAGTPVTLTWDNGETSQATVFGVSREVADGTVEVVIALGEGDLGRPSGSPATIEVANAQRDGVVAVPVSAIVASPGGGDAVRVPAVGGAGDRIVPVKLGIVADGWAEITEGLEAGVVVRLPG